MSARRAGNPFLNQCLSIALLITLSFAFSAFRLSAQTAESLSAVKRVVIDWPDSDNGSIAVRDRVQQKLKAGTHLEIVSQPAQADAVLHGRAAMWLTGYVYMSPRSKSAQQATYRGFASMEVTGKDGKALWSYLVTPRQVGWKSITNDLADQLVHEFLLALEGNRAGERTADAAAPGTKSDASAKVNLLGAGATFPAPMYMKWFESFSHSRPDIQIQYSAVGSAEGLERFLADEVDFGATDMPLPDSKLSSPKGQRLQLATLVGAVVPIYNVKGAPDGLNLTPEVLAGIFLGKIERWNAPEIRAFNKHAKLPDEPIAVVHRSDGSGTTFAWTDYLSKVSPEWKSRFGAAAAVHWPVGTGAEHNDGVAEAVRKQPNSIGYVEFIYALQHQLDFATVRNPSGEFIKAGVDSITEAAKTLTTPEGNGFGTSIANATGKHVYPIATLTWIVIPAESHDPGKTVALRDLLRWILTAGQKQCESLGYAPLPTEFANRELQALAVFH